MTPRDRLEAGRIATHEGRFEEALSHFAWFHDHALEEDRSQLGVRLSFALRDWLALAEKYPPAWAAFRSRLDDKIARLGDGELDRDLFHDIKAMNARVNEDAQTADLFASLDAKHPEFAQRCCYIALSALVGSKRYALAAKYFPDPLSHMLAKAETLARDVKNIVDRPRTDTPRYRVCVHVFAEELLRMEEVVAATRDADSAAQLRSQALAVLKPAYLRNAIVKLLTGLAAA
jgi:hypothetical protein